MFVMARIVPGEVVGSDACERTLPRYVWRAVMLALAESAARRLIIIAARGVTLKTRLSLRGPAATGAPEAPDAAAHFKAPESADAAEISGPNSVERRLSGRIWR
jgi:hypothetical protein